MFLPSNKVLDPDEVTVTRFKVLGASIAIILMARGAAPAELTPGQAAADWMQSYGERNKECLEWTDTCVNCVRAQSVIILTAPTLGSPANPKMSFA